MTAYFEEGVFTDAMPAWHGMGEVKSDQYLTLDQIRESAPLVTSPIVKSPVFAAFDTGIGDEDDDSRYTAINTDDWWMNVRAADQRCVGVVSSIYQLIQPEEVYAFGEQLIDDGARWKTTGSLKDGRMMWAQLELPDALVIAGEDFQRNLLLSNSYDGSIQFSAHTCTTRVVCWNTWNMAIGQAKRSWAIRHTESAKGRIQEARLALGLAFKLDDEMKKLGEQLAVQKMSQRELTAFLKKLIPDPKPAGPFDDPEAAHARLAQAKHDLALQSAKDDRFDLNHVITQAPNLENIRDTRWGALQGVLEWTQRYQAPRRSKEATLRKAVLKTPALNVKALELLAAS